jgi:hypothetical protein
MTVQITEGALADEVIECNLLRCICRLLAHNVSRQEAAALVCSWGSSGSNGV